MELNLTAKQAQRWHWLNTLLADELQPLTTKVEAAGSIDTTVLQTLQQHSISQTGLPASSSRLSDQALTVLAVAQQSASLATLLATWWQVADAVVTYGTDQQWQTYLTPLQLLGLPATGAEASVNPPLTAKIVPAGWQLTGTVSHVIHAGLAAAYLVTAETEPGVVNAFLVAADAPGLTVTSPFAPVGLHGLTIADLTLDHVQVTAANRLGALGGGIAVRQRAESVGQFLLAAVSAGTLENASQQIQRLAFTEQPPLIQLTPLLAFSRSLGLDVLSTASQADLKLPFTKAAALTGFTASQYSVARLNSVTKLIGNLAYNDRSPLMALNRDLQTLPFLMGTPGELAKDFAISTLSEPANTEKAHVESVQIEVSDLHRVVKRLHLTKDVPVNVGSIATAKRVVALGRGALEPATLLQAQQLAKWIGAAIAVTQPLTALEQFSVEQQIGDNAVTIAPEVLINLGVSGDEHYLAGMAGAHHVLSVNQDVTAPVMTVSQEVFVGTVKDFLAGMVAALN
ncbi:FAD-binding protein [Lactiplantibacillus plajomi]|uniref:FAD-binding protein n=1 Tax=Lactiplantibacillus plajomi TaxID=1457217 RepID=A0ABV6K665_9LACO|nr:FAD-binding protein [Lactiplantibacillus plajomi]